MTTKKDNVVQDISWTATSPLREAFTGRSLVEGQYFHARVVKGVNWMHPNTFEVRAQYGRWSGSWQPREDLPKQFSERYGFMG